MHLFVFAALALFTVVFAGETLRKVRNNKKLFNYNLTPAVGGVWISGIHKAEQSADRAGMFGWSREPKPAAAVLLKDGLLVDVHYVTSHSDLNAAMNEAFAELEVSLVAGPHPNVTSVLDVVYGLEEDLARHIWRHYDAPDAKVIHAYHGTRPQSAAKNQATVVAVLRAPGTFLPLSTLMGTFSAMQPAARAAAVRRMVEELSNGLAHLASRGVVMAALTPDAVAAAWPPGTKAKRCTVDAQTHWAVHVLAAGRMLGPDGVSTDGTGAASHKAPPQLRVSEEYVPYEALNVRSNSLRHMIRTCKPYGPAVHEWHLAALAFHAYTGVSLYDAAGVTEAGQSGATHMDSEVLLADAVDALMADGLGSVLARVNDANLASWIEDRLRQAYATFQ